MTGSGLLACSHPAPPPQLSRDLEVDPLAWSTASTYTLIGSLVVPRPVAWISTLCADGRANLAPYSYFNLVADDPPHVMFSSIGVKRTLANIRASGEYVINLAGREVLDDLERAVHGPAPAPPTLVDAGGAPAFRCGLAGAPARTVAPPRLRLAKAHLECTLVAELPAGNGIVVVGRVAHIHVDPSVWSDGRVQPHLYDPVVRLSRRYGALGAEVTAEEEPSDHVLAADDAGRPGGTR